MARKNNKSNSVWSDAEKVAWLLPKNIAVSQWSDENIKLDSLTTASPGNFRTDFTPYAREIMDSFRDPTVTTIVLKTSTQIAKTQSILNCVSYVIDQDPGPALFVSANETEAKNLSNDRLIPQILSSESVSSHMTAYKNDLKAMHMRFDRMILYMASADSPSALSGKPIRYLFMDEINKFPVFSGKEANPCDLAIERLRTYMQSKKIIEASTPTTKTGRISVDYELSDKRKYYVPCVHCGVYQLLLFPHIKFHEGERNAEKIEKDKSAWYECPHCKGKIKFMDKIRMINKGVWCPDGCSVDKDGHIQGEIPVNSYRGYWINCLYSPWLTFSEIAAKFLRSKDKPEMLMNFTNSWLAEEWEEKIQGTDENKIKSCIVKTNGDGIVPEGGIILTAGVDVQKDHFYYVIRAWGHSWRSWLVKAKQVETWEDIENEVLSPSLVFNSANLNIPPFPIRVACLDSGNDSETVYQHCLAYRDFARPIKGVDSLRKIGVPFRATTLEKFPSNGRPIPGGLTLWSLDTDYYKTKIYRWINADEKRWFLYGTIFQDYEKQIMSEKIITRDKNGKARTCWSTSSHGVANHYLDCEVYAAAAAEMMRVYTLTAEDEPKPIKPVPMDEKKQDESNPFLPRTQGWLNR